MTRKRWFFALTGAIAGVAVLFAACGGGDNGAPTSAGDGNGAATREIDQDNLKFKPDKLTVKVGETVTFMNSETAIHTVTIAGKNESGTMKKGDVFTWTPQSAGVYKITCDFHPQMKATITVTE